MKQRWYCPDCKKVRLATIEKYGEWIKITCSKGHVENRKIFGRYEK